MFNNPGKKVKGIAIVLFVILLVAYVLAGIYFITYGWRQFGDRTLGIIAGVASIALGFLFSWISAIFLYAWGNMVDDIQTIKERLEFRDRMDRMD